MKSPSSRLLQHKSSKLFESHLMTLLQDDWPEGYQLAAAMNFKFQQTVSTPFSTIVNSVSDDGLKLMTEMMLWNPEKRPTAASVSETFTNWEFF